MRIAEAASRSGLSIDTIRYYEKSGIVPPIDRGSDGRRRFTEEDIDWLTLLYLLRETGMAMKTMHRFALLYREGDETIADRKAVLLEHAEHLKRKRGALDHCETMLQHKLALYRERER